VTSESDVSVIGMTWPLLLEDQPAMILDFSSFWSLLQNCPTQAANEKVGRCGRAVLVAQAVFARLPRNESFTLNTRLGHLSITQQALIWH
jgi:hypothetical protein